MNNGSEVAVIGMAGRFPGAATVSQFWENLRNGTESVRFFSEEELLTAGIDPHLLKQPNYVKAKAYLEEADCFDAIFFGYSPREAEIMDPQHRVFLEAAYHALEDAGYASEKYKGAIGIYAGADTNTYLLNNLLPDPQLLATVGGLQLLISNEKNHMLTRASYKLNLRGPSITVQSACSTALTAIHLACQSLLSGECDLALAGGISVSAPLKSGYLYEKGLISSPDGHCRSFDAQAQGTVSGNGVGLVVLKLLEAAVADGDYVYAVIKGSAVNNDGALKVGYTAPSIEGQARVVAEALAVAEVAPETIQYVEANGTGSELGDSIEVEALTKAYRQHTAQTGFCGIGSVKTNIGHLNEAAGIAGFIKAVCALYHQQIPPTLHYQYANPHINFAQTPFYVVSQLQALNREQAGPIRMGVNAFGMGGANAHIILEEAAARAATNPSPLPQVLVLTAKTKAALEIMTQQLYSHLYQQPGHSLADVAYTLQVGRRTYKHRQMVVCEATSPASVALDPSTLYQQALYEESEPGQRYLVGLLAGRVPDHLARWQEMYQQHPLFRQVFDTCASAAQPLYGIDLRQQWAASTWDYGPALALAFSLEYALVQLLHSWGAKPLTFIGWELGEYVAAASAQIFSPAEALALLHAVADVAMHGQQLPAQSWPTKLVVAADGQLPAAFGLTSGQDELANKAAWQRGVEEACARISFQAPQTPYFSTSANAWATGADISQAVYWIQQLTVVSVDDALQTVLADRKNSMLLSYGDTCPSVPWSVLMALAPEYESALLALAHTAGKLWISGIAINWKKYAPTEKRGRVPLPGYPFERQRYWLDGRLSVPASPANQPVVLMARPDTFPYQAPQTDTEQYLATLWGGLLGLQDVGLDDHFFELGGHSLLGIRILSAVHEKFKLDLPIAILYERPTIRELAEVLDTKRWLASQRPDPVLATTEDFEEGTL